MGLKREIAFTCKLSIIMSLKCLSFAPSKTVIIEFIRAKPGYLPMCAELLIAKRKVVACPAR